MAEQFEQLLSPAEAAKALGVHVKTISAWARSGKLKAYRTIGGHRRYKAADCRALLDGTDPDSAA